MASKHGLISEFEAGREDWTSYTERLQQYFAANDVDSAEKQRAIFLSACGAQTYQLLKNLLAPEKPMEKSFEELVELMKNHLQPRPSVIVERFTFHSRNRKEGESVAVYVAELKKLSEHCGFGDTLNDMLRDRLVCGINDGGIQRRLLSEPDLTYKKSLNLAQAMEAAERNVQDLKGSNVGIEKLYMVKDTTQRSQNISCYRCGGNHRAAECHFKDLTCHNCGKQVHIARVCRSEAKRAQSSSSIHQKETHQIQSEPSDVHESDEYTLYNIKDPNHRPMEVIAEINGVEVTLEVDTGATLSLISKDTYKRLWHKAIAPTSVLFCLVSGRARLCRGYSSKGFRGSMCTSKIVSLKNGSICNT